jgi:hypothetical protein
MTGLDKFLLVVVTVLAVVDAVLVTLLLTQ